MGTVISSGTKTVKSGETLDQPTITNSGTVVVSSGGIVTLAQIVNSGHEIVESGGVDSGSIIYDWGELILKNGGCAYSVDVYDNGYISAMGGSVFSATIGSNGDVLLKGWSSGGSMVSGYISKVTIKHRWGELTLSSGGVASDVTMTEGAVTVFSGGYLQKTSLGRTSSSYYNSKMAQVNISEGQANLNYINWEGFVNVCSGGTATSNFVYSGGSILAKKDGLIYSNSVLGGTAILSGGTAADTTIDSGGTFDITAGGRCSNTTVTSGNMNIYRGVASATTLINGRVSNCGESVSATCSGGSVYVNCGSSISEKLLGGQMTVSGGSSAGGDYSYVRDLTIQSATVYFYNSNYLEVATVSKGGRIVINSGTRASSVDVMHGGAVSIESGGFASDVTLRGVVVSCGDGARMDGDVSADGVARFLGGTTGGMTVSSGGILSITRNLAMDTGKITFGVGGSLDFDISDFSASSDTPLFGTKGGKGYDSYIANLADAACSLTVGDTQLLTEATYVLASEASTFNNTITVKYANAGVEFGTLTVGGTTRIGDMNFTLSRGTDNALSVTVASATPTPTPSGTAKSDIDGNGISDVMFVWTGEHGEGNYQHGYWMNGTNEWQSANSGHPAEWENLGCYDMNANGKADSVLVGNVVTEIGGKGAYIGYYLDANDLPDGSTWQNIGYLNNEENIAWQNKVCNLTGNADGVNSIIWYAPDLFALGVWKDGTTEWATISNTFGGSDWNLVGCGDFSGAGKDSVLMSYNNGQLYYVVGLDGAAPKALGNSDWRGWEIRAIGDFAGDGKDDIVLFHHDTGSMVMCADGKVDDFVSIGQLAANDWFVVGAGDYNGDAKDDLLVRQYSTGMLGYYVCADQSQWVEMGRGVGMEWTVIA